MGVTTCDILDHLMDRYSNITAADLKPNEARINKVLYHSRPIDIFSQRIDDSVQYADDEKTIYGKTNLANVISLRQHNQHVPRGMQGMAT